MAKTSYPGIDLQEAPGLFHSMPNAAANRAGPIVLLDGRNLPFRRDSLPVGTSPGPPTDWKYINVRHFVLYIEQSLSQGVRWAVFQNNGPALWSRVANLIDDFLMNQWLQGKLHGKKKQEAYFVKCDSSTMSQNDLDNGRLVALVGFAPVRPAEFIVVQIGIQTRKE